MALFVEIVFCCYCLCVDVWCILENHHKQLTSTAGYIIGAVFPLPDYLSHWIYWQLEQKSRIYILHDSAWEKKIWETQATIRTNQTCGIKARKSSIDNEIWAYSDSNYICLYHSCTFCYVWFLWKACWNYYRMLACVFFLPSKGIFVTFSSYIFFVEQFLFWPFLMLSSGQKSHHM